MMRKRDKILLSLWVSVLSGLLVGSIYAAITISFHQNLQVPAIIEVYRSDGITLIAPGSDQASIWSWDDVNMRFVAQIKVKNMGATNIDVAIVSSLVSPWVFSTSGSLTGILPGELRAVTLYEANPLAVGGLFTGDFSVSVSKV